MIIESQNIVIKHLVNRLRDIRTGSFEFRTTIEEISRILLSEPLAKSLRATVHVKISSKFFSKHEFERLASTHHKGIKLRTAI